jgi:hypothetical protein
VERVSSSGARETPQAKSLSPARKEQEQPASRLTRAMTRVSFLHPRTLKQELVNTPQATKTTDSTKPIDSTTHPAESGAVPHQKQQGADRPDEEPSQAQTAAIADKKDAAESTQDKASSSQSKITSDEERNELAQKGELPHDPNDHSGEPMKMHAGGDPEAKVEGETLKEKTERSASVGQEGGGEHGKVKGTGEEWVKTSGIAAEGGDFDATKPGAGREATRKLSSTYIALPQLLTPQPGLMEEKGIKTEGATIDSTAPKPETASATSEEKAKVSKMAKLKDKLHIGSSKN